MSHGRASMGHFPVLPWLAVYALGFAAAAVSNFIWEPARYLAIPLYWVGPAGVATVGAFAVLRGPKTQGLAAWAALIGGAFTLLFQTWAQIVGDSQESAIGPGFIWLLGWILMIVGGTLRTVDPRGAEGV